MASPHTPKSPPKVTPGGGAGRRADNVTFNLRQIIGTTAYSSCAFDAQASARQYAYSAGSAAVVATVRDDLTVSQQFFRARPGAYGEAGPFSPGSPADHKRTLNLTRDRAAGSPRHLAGREDSPTRRTLTAKDRVKAVTSVALSTNGKWVAVGETGYKPRVLLFSNTKGTCEDPITVLTEHSYGVHALAFSPDSKYLATLGNINDGYLLVWRIDSKSGLVTLHSSNKCSVVINSMKWSGRKLVTAGVRYVKVWQIDDDVIAEDSGIESGPLRQQQNVEQNFNSSNQRHRVLLGKNALLNDLIDATFIAIVSVNAELAFICADSGEVCLLNDQAGPLSLTLAAKVEFRITAACICDGQLQIEGRNGARSSFMVTDLLSGDAGACGAAPDAGHPRPNSSASVIASAVLDNALVQLYSNHEFTLRKLGSDVLDSISSTHKAHGDAIVGLRVAQSLLGASFYTYSRCGQVLFWNDDGESRKRLQIPIEGAPDGLNTPNELRAISLLQSGMHCVACDKYGTLSLVEVETNKIVTRVRAHTAEVIDCVAFERRGVQLISTASRDRTVQLFVYRHNTIELLQTLDEHAGSVTSLDTMYNGEFLISCSADRSVVIRAAVESSEDSSDVAYVMTRALSLKSAPTSMYSIPGTDEVIVALTDASISMFNIKTGRMNAAFKNDGAVTLSRVINTTLPDGSETIIGICGGEKSLHMFTKAGNLMTRDWGHTEGITDVAVLPSDGEKPTRVITVAADSTIFIWDIVLGLEGCASKETHDALVGGGDRPLFLTLRMLGSPVRKVLSHADLAKFRREHLSDNSGDSEGGAQTPQVSPSRLKKKSMRTLVTRPPPLEPTQRNPPPDRTLAKRESPSPTSPMPTAEESPRRFPRLERAKTSESTPRASPPPSLQRLPTSNSPSSVKHAKFGSLTSSTESVLRTLQAYREKLTNRSEKVDGRVAESLVKELQLTLHSLQQRIAPQQQQQVDGASVDRSGTNDVANLSKALEQSSLNAQEAQTMPTTS